MPPVYDLFSSVRCVQGKPYKQDLKYSKHTPALQFNCFQRKCNKLEPCALKQLKQMSWQSNKKCPNFKFKILCFGKHDFPNINQKK